MITIPLSKRGKYAGLYTAQIDECDQALARLNWSALLVHRRDGTVRMVYAVRREGNAFIYLHREVLGVDDPTIKIDHVDGNGLHCWRYNLRLASKSQNGCNMQPQAGTSCYKGVYWHAAAGKWQTGIHYKGEHLYLGLFDNETEAGLAYDKASRYLHGEFGRQNFKEVTT